MREIKFLTCLTMSILFFIACETESVIQEQVGLHKKITFEKTTVNYDVIIKLVDENTGWPVSANSLPGYVARNLNTGVLYYTSRYEIDLFESLPSGTYRFDAYDGYFDGASSSTVTLSHEIENEDGFIEVTLKYWSE